MKDNRPNENELREQEAPLKNTDNAFVRVNKDGHPEMPVTREKDEKIQSDHPQKQNDER